MQRSGGLFTVKFFQIPKVIKDLGAPSPLLEVESVDWAPSINLEPQSSVPSHNVSLLEIIKSNHQPQMNSEETTSKLTVSKSTVADIDLPQTQCDLEENTLTAEDLMCSHLLEISMKRSINTLPGLLWRYKHEEKSLEDKQSAPNANSYVIESDTSNRTAKLKGNKDVDSLKCLKSYLAKKEVPGAQSGNIPADASVMIHSLNGTDDSPKPSVGSDHPDIQATSNNIKNNTKSKHDQSLEVRKRKNSSFSERKSDYKILKTEHCSLKMKYNSLQKRHKYSLNLVYQLRKHLKSSEAENHNLIKKLEAATELSKEKLEELKMIKDIVSIKTAEILKLQAEFKSNLRKELRQEILREVVTFQNNLKYSPTLL
ncbi:RTX-III toxin determinant D [Frankliniella fusca]|uniref:RTX-III toxin determinant D n=1 Tax=Frankliniella fusca TaxID=407009 RepID=A0AAE1LFE1_9NEOP|nr:RTX-III toxin determinant D [Frankliniella fusca]